MKWTIPAALLLATAVYAADLEKMAGEAKFSMSEALDRGLKEAGEGVIVKIELEDKDGKAVYAMDIAQGTGIVDLALDVKDGTVIEKETDAEEDHSDVVKAAKVSLSQAIATAVKDTPGTAVFAKLRMKDGKPQAAVRILAGGKVKKILLDAESGTILKTEVEEDKDEDKADEGKDDEKEEAGKEDDEAGEDDEKPGEDDEAGEDDKAGEEDKKTGAKTGGAKGGAFTDVFGEDPADLVSKGTNPFFVLEPGFVLELAGKEDGEEVVIVITVLEETKKIDGVECRVVEEKEFEGGEVKEITRDYFAISKRTNNVYYFGEDVDNYKDGKVTDHGGSWLSGVNGARYGLLMPAVPLIGARYQQETAPGVAMDRAEVVSVTETFECPAGKFEGVLKTRESTPLEPGSEFKHYARGIGLIQDGALLLRKYGKAAAK